MIQSLHLPHALSLLVLATGLSCSNLGPAVTIGPPTASLVPTNTAACADGYPIQINPSFPQPFNGTGAQSCTLVVYTLNGQPTSAGKVVSATIGVGAVTGPMRFVRMRILGEASTGAACCSAEEFGPIFTPQANTTTTVPLDLTIERNADVNTGILSNDWVGLEVLAPNVPIPGIWTNNGGADITVPDYLWLPSLSSRVQAPPTQNLRSEGSFSGLLPTFNFSFAPAR